MVLLIHLSRVGVGFDTKGSAVANHKNIPVLKLLENNVEHIIIPDSREGMYLDIVLQHVKSDVDRAHR